MSVWANFADIYLQGIQSGQIANYSSWVTEVCEAG